MIKKLLVLVFILSAYSSSIAQTGCLRLAVVGPSQNIIAIRNTTSSSMDISNYRLCSLFSYTGSGIAAGTTVLSGSLTDLGPNETVSVLWDINNTAADLGLYLPSGAFSDPSAMVDFLQYGAAGQGRESEAVAAGLWTAGEFITTGFSIAWNNECDEHGVNAYFVIGGVGLEDTDQQYMSISPNPVFEALTIDFTDQVTEIESVSVYDVSGALIYKESLVNSGAHRHTISSQNWSTGLYFVMLRQTSGLTSVSRLLKE